MTVCAKLNNLGCSVPLYLSASVTLFVRCHCLTTIPFVGGLCLLLLQASKLSVTSQPSSINQSKLTA